MSHIFISHVEEDADIALELALNLEEAGYTAWCYELDSVPGPSYLLQTGAAIEQSKAVILVISPHSLGSRQVTREVVRAHESGIYFVPVLRDITHLEFQNRQPEWREAIGAATSTRIPKEGITGIFRRIVDGLETLDIHPTPTPDITRIDRIRKTLSEVQPPNAIEKGMKPDLEPLALQIPSTRVTERAKRKRLIRVGRPRVWVIAAAFIVVAVLGGWLYFNIAGGGASLSFNLVGTYGTSGAANSVFVVGDIAYIASGSDGLLILDVSVPSKPKKIGQYPPIGAENVVVVDNVAYVTQQGVVEGSRALRDKLVLLDVGIPSNPIKLGEYEHNRHRSLDNIAVVGNIAYLPTSGKLILVDVSTPSGPVKMGDIEFESNIAYPGVTVVDNIAYVKANDFRVIDVRRPSEPVQIGQLDIGWGDEVVVVGELAYALEWWEGLDIIDVSVPSHPVKIGGYKEVGRHELIPPGTQGRLTMLELSVAGNTAYVTYNFGIDHGTWTEALESGIIAIDVSDPCNPVKIAEYLEIEGTSSVFVLGDLVFVTDPTRGLFIFSLGEPRRDH